MVGKINRKKILVLGAGGLLGSEVVRMFSQNHSYIVKSATRSELDISKGMDVAVWIERLHPDFVINCAALANVDYCEEHPDEANKINAEGVKNICLPLEESGGKLIHISTNYVFDGKKDTPYLETDAVNPLGHYAESKLKAEAYVKKLLPSSVVARVQWLYGEQGHSFASKIIQDVTKNNFPDHVSLIRDIVGTPTSVGKISEGIIKIIENDAKGIFHLSCEGSCSWVDFGKKIFELNKNPNANRYIKPISEASCGRKAERPKYSVLSTEKFTKTCGMSLGSWEEELKTTIEKLKRA